MKTQQSKRNPASGFTLIELVVFVALLVCIKLGADFVHARVGGVLGWVLGGFLGLVAFLLVGLAVTLLKDFAVGGIPRLPRCREGICRGPGIFRADNGNYKSQKFGEIYVYVCQHGGRYKRCGRRFVVVNDDNTETPYLIWRPFRGWFPDEPTKS